MEVVINGKKYNLIRTLHLTECSCDSGDKHYIQEASFIVYDERNEKGDFETHVLYFRDDELESISL